MARASVAALLLVLAVSGFASAQAGQAAPPTRVSARPGAAVTLGRPAACMKAVVPAGAPLEVFQGSDKLFTALYRVPATQQDDIPVTIETGTAAKADNTCDGAVQQHFTITIDRAPAIPDAALSRSFTILMSAFVLALLLESAFALLFNWRLFHELFVGKAWKTPIMFIAALAVVRQFDLDLMATLFDAYNPPADGKASPGGWLTSSLTAMILAGGSAGVNNVLVGLGFRSQTTKGPEPPALNENEAWLAIEIFGKTPPQGIQVNVDEVTQPDGTAPPPITVSVVHPRGLRERLRNLFFPSQSRVPRSGGRTVDPRLVYRITLVNLADGKMFDSSGNPIQSAGEARLFRFGSRSIVDLEVKLP